MNLLKSLSLCMLMSIGISNVNAQQVSIPCQNDPIVEMLDSLVTLNNVVRFNNVNTYGAGVTTNVNLPLYSDEIYSQRISKIYSPIPLTYNDQVKQYIDLYAYRKRELTSRVLGLSNLYFPLFEQILDQQGLPLEFKYLSVVESALNPLAVSRVGATGLWQFMYNTGKIYDLKTSSFFDDRKDPVKSTYAACKYFKDMYSIYGDWLLVIAAYNCGAGNVNKAIKRSGGKTNFWEISRYLPAETRGYVPAFIAVTYVMNYSSEHNLFPVTPAYNYFEVDTVSVDNSIALKKIAEAIDLPVEAVAFLNPIYKRGIIPDTENPNILRLPANKVAAYISAEAELFAPPVPEVAIANGVSTDESDDSDNAKIIAVSEKVNQPYTYKYKNVKKSYLVRAGDNLSGLARRFDCTVSDLKKWNRLHSGSLLKGQRISYFEMVKVKVPVKEKEVTASVPDQKNDSASESPKQLSQDNTSDDNTVAQTKAKTDGKFIYHLVQKGDTLWNIAKRYEGVTVQKIMEINSITDITNLKPGTKIKVMVNG